VRYTALLVVASVLSSMSPTLASDLPVRNPAELKILSPMSGTMIGSPTTTLVVRCRADDRLIVTVNQRAIAAESHLAWTESTANGRLTVRTLAGVPLEVGQDAIVVGAAANGAIAASDEVDVKVADRSVVVATAFREALYSVRVNGKPVSDGSTLLFDGSGRLYAAAPELARWRFNQPTSPATQWYRGLQYIALASYDGLVATVDSKSQELDITTPVNHFAVTDVSLRETVPRPMSVAQAGSFLNYALHAETGLPTFLNGLFDVGLSERSGGAFRTRVLTQGTQAVRLDTAWQIDDPDKHRSINVGDYVTRTGTFGIPIRFAGVSVGTDFSTDPMFITFPTASVRGLATLPSAVDVFVNGYQTGTAPLPPGPFEVGTISGVSGQNQAQVVVRDITGGEHVIGVTFYSSPALLKRGLSDYSYQAGFERFDFGTRSLSYGPPFAQGLWRHGLSDNLTAEAHVELGSLFQVYGVAGTLLLHDAGTLTAGLAQSTGSTGYGRQLQVGYEYRSPHISVFTQAQVADLSFRELGFDAAAGFVRNLWQSGVSFNAGRGNQISLTSINRRLWGSATQRFLNVILSHSIRRGSLQFAYTVPSNGLAPTVTGSLIASFGPRGSASTASAVHQGKLSQDVAVQLGLPASGTGESFNFRGHGGDSNSVYAAVTHQTQTNAASLALFEFNNKAYAAADLTGSLVFLNGRSLAARPVTGAYGLVQVPGYAGVGVIVNNQEVGKTDKNGDFVTSSLEPYSSSQISIDPSNLPISANIASFSATTVPTRGGAVVVRFSTQDRGGGVIIAVLDRDGVPLPTGTAIRDVASNVWPVAEDGQAYLAGIHRGRQTLTTQSGGTPCRFVVTVPDDMNEMPDLGKFVCQAEVVSR
jgi:outer membrane usher protein